MGKGYKGTFRVIEAPVSWKLYNYPCMCKCAETHKISALCILSLFYFKTLSPFRQIPITIHSPSLLFPSLLLASCSGILQRLRLAPGAFLAAGKEKSIMRIKACQEKQDTAKCLPSRVLSWHRAQTGVLAPSDVYSCGPAFTLKADLSAGLTSANLRILLPFFMGTAKACGDTCLLPPPTDSIVPPLCPDMGWRKN